MTKYTVKTFILTIFVLFFASTWACATDYDIWMKMQEADSYEQAGDLANALPLWLDIIAYFETGTDEASWTNAALYHKKAGKYYDSITDYDNAIYHYEKENEFWLMLGKDWGTEDMIRADQIRTVFDIYVQTEPTMNRPLAQYEPAAGYYNGIYCEHDANIGQNLNRTDAAYGHHAMFLFYEEWGNIYQFDYGVTSPFDTKMGDRIKQEGAAFQQALNSSLNGLDAIDDTSWIRNWADRARSSNIPIFLRFLPEMNGDWTSWGGDPESYVEKFRLIHDIMAEHAPNVVMVWCPNDVPVELNGKRIEDYYPGDDYVDWVGVNFYVDYYNSGDPSLPDNRLQNPLDHLKYIYEMYHERKPIIICETGVSHYSITTGEDLTDWAVANLEKLYAMLPVIYPDVKAITYFSMDQGSPLYNNRDTVWNNYRLSDNSYMADKYRELMKSSSIVHEMGGSAEFTYKKTDTSEMPLYNKVIFDIKIVDYKISRVDFFVDGTLVKSDNSLPFSLEYNLAFANRLTIKVYDSKGNFAIEKELALNDIDTSLSGAYSAGFNTGMTFCRTGIGSCDAALGIRVPDMPDGQNPVLDSSGRLEIPCLWIGSSLFNITLNTTGTPDTGITAELSNAELSNAGENIWFAGYIQGVKACLDDTLGCSQDVIRHAFVNECAEYDMVSNNLIMPFMSTPDGNYDVVMLLTSSEPVQLQQIQADRR